MTTRQAIEPASAMALSRAKLWILFLVAIIVSMGCLVLSSEFEGFVRNILFAVGTGFLVSALFGITQVVLASGSTQTAMLSRITSEIRSAMGSIRAEHEQANTTYFPTHQFPESDHPLPEYNHVFMADLAQTNELMMRGVSARYTAARLLADSIANIELTVVLPDLKSAASLTERVNYIRRFEQPDAQEGAVRQRVRREVLVGIVGLYKARYSCRRIRIVLTPSPTLDQVELMHNSAWITPFTDVQRPTERYAAALRFDNDALVYKMQRSSIARIADSPIYKKFELTKNTSEIDFFKQYNAMTGENIDTDGYTTLSAEFDSFARQFTTIAKLGTN